jgi:hypothetical protein
MKNLRANVYPTHKGTNVYLDRYEHIVKIKPSSLVPMPDKCPICKKRLSIKDERGGYCTDHYWIIGGVEVRLAEKIFMLQDKLKKRDVKNGD